MLFYRIHDPNVSEIAGKTVLDVTLSNISKSGTTSRNRTTMMPGDITHSKSFINILFCKILLITLFYYISIICIMYYYFL